MDNAGQHLTAHEVERLTMSNIPRLAKEILPVGDAEREHAETCLRCGGIVTQTVVEFKMFPLEDYPPAE